MPENAPVVQIRRPRGFVPIGVFFIFGAVMTTYAALTLLMPGTVLDVLWSLNKQGHESLIAVGPVAAGPFIVLSPLLALAAIGWLRRRRWGLILGCALIAINLLGDASQIAFGQRLKGVIGVLAAGLLLYYMTRRGVRAYFRTAN